MNWQEYFQNHILERGLNYYLQDRVSSYKKNFNHISATVSGTNSYLVKAYFEGNELTTLTCTCPHAAGDNFCKHMAAVMYAYENQKDQPQKNQAVKSVDDYVKNADEKVVRKFLTNVLFNDPYLLKQFVTSLGSPITPVDMDQFQNDLSHIFSDYLYPNGFIEYGDAWDFYSDVDDYMEKTIQKLLIANDHYKEAFELTNEMFLSLIELPIDDSLGTTNDIADDCSELWEMILDSADFELKSEMFEWFTNKLETTSLDYLESYIEDILFSNFYEDEFMDKKISLAKRQIMYFEEHAVVSIDNYTVGRWALYYLRTIDHYEEMQEEVKQFCEKNLEYIGVREFYIDKLIDSKEFEKAIHLLEDGKNQNISVIYREKLKDLYLEVGKEVGYIEELYSLILQYGGRRMDLFEEYKAQFSEEKWAEKRKVLINEISLWQGQDTILHKEEMYDELFELAIETSGLSMLQKHEDLLYEMDAEKVLDKYEDEILEESKRTSNRRTYREITNNIRQLKQLSNYDQRVSELVSYLKKTYKNRPAMMDELSRI